MKIDLIRQIAYGYSVQHIFNLNVHQSKSDLINHGDLH